MTDPVDMIVPLLRERRADNLLKHERTRALVMTREKRISGVEDAQRSFRQAMTADNLLSTRLTGEFKEHIEALENRLREPEGLT
jgi:hypothetical protein